MKKRWKLWPLTSLSSLSLALYWGCSCDGETLRTYGEWIGHRVDITVDRPRPGQADSTGKERGKDVGRFPPWWGERKHRSPDQSRPSLLEELANSGWGELLSEIQNFAFLSWIEDAWRKFDIIGKYTESLSCWELIPLSCLRQRDLLAKLSLAQSPETGGTASSQAH